MVNKEGTTMERGKQGRGQERQGGQGAKARDK
jgi:hypothetical protein